MIRQLGRDPSRHNKLAMMLRVWPDTELNTLLPIIDFYSVRIYQSEIETDTPGIHWKMLEANEYASLLALFSATSCGMT